jgi:hypothetical protein
MPPGEPSKPHRDRADATGVYNLDWLEITAAVVQVGIADLVLHGVQRTQTRKAAARLAKRGLRSKPGSPEPWRGLTVCGSIRRSVASSAAAR